MQPPQNPYGQQPTQPPQGQPPYPQQPQPQYPQQPQQPPYGYPPQQQQAQYSREYRPAGGRYGTPTAGGFDILLGVLQIILATGAIGIGGLAAIGGAAIQSGAVNSSNSPSLANLPAGAGMAATVFGMILFVWGILMIVAAVGIFKFRKWGMLMTGIMALISAGYYGWSTFEFTRVAGASTANQGAFIVQIVFTVMSLIYTIYGFARTSAAN